jgi:hypothetical protein
MPCIRHTPFLTLSHSPSSPPMHRIALFLLTLSTLAHGSPFLCKRDGLKAIPLERLGSVQDLSVKTIEQSTRHSVERLHRSLDNYERNTGAPLSHAGSIAERSLLRKRAVYSDIHEDLEPMSNGAWWSAKIDVGSPGYIRVNVLLDTGSTDVWLVSASCSKNCGTAPKVSQSVMPTLNDYLIIRVSPVQSTGGCPQRRYFEFNVPRRFSCVWESLSGYYSSW